MSTSPAIIDNVITFLSSFRVARNLYVQLVHYIIFNSSSTPLVSKSLYFYLELTNQLGVSLTPPLPHPFLPPQENTDEMPVGMLLVGNKTDLGEQDEREVSTETGETFSKVSSVRSFWGEEAGVLRGGIPQ